MRKVVFGREDNKISLSANIVDKDRQALAYNMLYYMAEHGASITVGGKSKPLEKDQLWLAEQLNDTLVTYTKPHLDPEWFGANGDQFERGDTRFSTASMGNDGVLVRFAPLTVSYDKANEMNNFMLMGLDPAVSISYLQDGEMKPVVVNGRPIHEGMINDNGQLVTERFDRNWNSGEASKILFSTEDRKNMYTFAGERKYELLRDDTRKANSGDYDEFTGKNSWSQKDCTVYRIRALRDFGDVKAGDLGGFVECESNLSHDGNCWIYDNAAACCDAVVKDNATVRGDATICQAAVISGEANVFGEARIEDNAKISDHAQVGWEWDGTTSKNGKWKNADTTFIKNNAEISGNAQVLGEVVVSENAKIRDNARVEGKWPSIPDDKYKAYYISAVCDNAVIEGDAKVTNAYVRSNAHIYENAVVSGHQKMGGHAEIAGHAQICGDAKITHNVTVNGLAKIGGTVEITDKVNIGYDANVQKSEDYFSLKELGKTSYAVNNQDGGVTIVHKGKTYNDIDKFKAAMGDVDDECAAAIEQMEDHFNNQMMQGFEEGIASISGDADVQLGQ